MTPRKPRTRKQLGVTLEQYQNCTRCGERLPLDSFYFVSKKLGTRRGQCKGCMREVKLAQRDPAWLPTCTKCGNERPRSGPGRRLCAPCFDELYDTEDRRSNGAHRLKLQPCSACGTKRLRADHVHGGSLCPLCRSVPQSRRNSLKNHYRMTPREYLALLAEQGDACAICGTDARKRPLHMDHRHSEPSLIRGGLCNSCNTMIGLARDRPDILRTAAAYLEEPPAQRLFPGRAATHKANRPTWNRLTRVAGR